MRLVLQRVSQASVSIDNKVVASIGHGLLAFVGIAEGDSEAEAHRMAAKTAELRIFDDAEGRFNLSLADIGGSVLVVSQFTLHADLRRGRRPSFVAAARPEVAEPLIEAYAVALESLDVVVARGVFGAHMTVSLVNDGPVTLILDSDDMARPRRG
jgi:D-tyrosyl-tRNA(Tyr) deacylase